MNAKIGRATGLDCAQGWMYRLVLSMRPTQWQEDLTGEAARIRSKNLARSEQRAAVRAKFREVLGTPKNRNIVYGKALQEGE